MCITTYTLRLVIAPSALLQSYLLNTKTKKKHKISPNLTVIGAGYAGTSAAKRLVRGDVRVTVVNSRADFVERIRLHQLVAGNHQATLPLRSLLPSSATFVQDTAQSVDAERGVVTLAGGSSLDFDYLIYTVGSCSRLDVVPGAAEHGVTVGGGPES